MSEPLRLAVFDCDGTLVDSQHSIVAAMNAAFDVNGLQQPERSNVLQMVGLPLIDAIINLAPDLEPGIHQKLRDGYAEAWQEMRRRGQLQDPLYPGSREVLLDLEADGWLLGVATGKSYRGLLSTLETHGLADRFQTLQTADRALGKPHPDMLIRAMQETGAGKKDTVMVGDTTFDMEMAKSAGVTAIGVAWGYHDVEELRAAGAEIVIERFDDLPKIIERSREERP